MIATSIRADLRLARSRRVCATFIFPSFSDLGRGQGRHDGIRDGVRGSPGQVVACSLDELEASIRQGAYQPAGGFEGNDGVPGVGEHENRHPDRRKGVLQLVELAQQGTLFGQESSP
jgi:hypothetical protein